MKIRDYLGINTEKEAELKAKAIFSQERNSRLSSRKEKFSPFEKAVMEGISPAVEKISKGDIPHPFSVRVHLSYTCNHNCSWCLYGDDRRKEIVFMDSDSFKKLLESLHCLKVKFIDLSGGGEPTLHPEFHKFAQMCVKEKFKLSLLTNATSLDQKIVSLLVEGFSFLRVNLDASNDVVYNRIHHPPTPREFQKVLGNLERVASERERKKTNLILGAKVWLGQANMNFVEQITCLVKDLGIDYIQFQINQKAFDSLLSEQKGKVNLIIKELKYKYHPFEVYGEVETGEFRRGCWLSPICLIIDPSGTAYACSQYPYRPEATCFGNIFTQPVENLWFGSEHRRIVEQLRESACPVQDCRWHLYNDMVGLLTKNNST